MAKNSKFNNITLLCYESDRTTRSPCTSSSSNTMNIILLNVKYMAQGIQEWTKQNLWKTVFKIAGLRPAILLKKTLSRPYHFNFFKDCLPQILLGPFLTTLTHIMLMRKVSLISFATFFLQCKRIIQTMSIKLKKEKIASALQSEKLGTTIFYSNS